MSKVCIVAYVSGVVQGVGFRYFTRQQAQELRLTGYVANMDDGRVKVIACGQPDNVEALISWLRAGGPPSARVDKVVTEPQAVKEYAQFDIRY